MDAQVESEQRPEDIAETMLALGARARDAARLLATAPTSAKNDALRLAAKALLTDMATILAANATDVAAAQENGKTDAFIDRLTLKPDRIDAMAQGLDDIAALADPVGAVIAEWERPNGLRITRVRTPLGVIGIIFESRPNVTADAGALCLKSGNASILRGGSDSWHSARAIHHCLSEGLRQAGLPESAIQIVPTTDRAAVGEMLRGLGGAIDVIVPRGGKSLVGRVQDEARVPVFAHLEGICHVYVDKAADLEMAKDITVNAKMRRTGNAHCEVRGDAATQAASSQVVPASEEDWSTEHLDAVISVKTVDGVDDAIAHITRYGSQHTETIITDDAATADAFLSGVDSAIVMHNASTQFADGGEFGMGAEIGIATGRMHARGPVGLEQLTSFKYVVRGSGQTRPS